MAKDSVFDWAVFSEQMKQTKGASKEYFKAHPDHKEAFEAHKKAYPSMHSDLIEEIHGKDAQKRAAATHNAGWEGKVKADFEKRSMPVYAHLNREEARESYQALDKELERESRRLRPRGFGGEFGAHQWEQHHLGFKQSQAGSASLPVMAATAAAGALIAGAAQAAQSPDGQRFVEGAKAAAKAAAEGALPGVTETDMCKRVGKATGAVGATAGAIVLGGAGAAGGLVASPVGSAVVGAAGVAAGGTLGNEIGEKLGEGACNMARNVFKGKASTVQAAEASAAQAKEAATSPKTKNHGTAASRG